jgi:hypothetical protein
MLEIYNEEYKDLLARKKAPDGKAHKVCENPCWFVSSVKLPACTVLFSCERPPASVLLLLGAVLDRMLHRK